MKMVGMERGSFPHEICRSQSWGHVDKCQEAVKQRGIQDNSVGFRLERKGWVAVPFIEMGKTRDLM